MSLLQPTVQLESVDWGPPQITVGRRPCRDDAKTRGRPPGRRRRFNPGHHPRVDVVRRPVAIDCCTGGDCNDGSMAGGHSAPREPVHQGVLQANKGVEAGDRGID